MTVTESKVHKRLGLNFLAGVGSQVVTVMQQLLLVPVLLKAWGSEGYGVWLTVWAAVNYLWMMADFGFANVATSEIGMMVAAGRKDDAVAVFQSLLRLLCLMSVICLGAAWLAAMYAPVATWLGIPQKWEKEVSYSLGLLLSTVPVTLICGLLLAVFRGSGHMALGVSYYYVLSRGLETILIAIVALSGCSLTTTAAWIVGFKVLTLIVFVVMAARVVPWAKLGQRHASWALVRRMVRPAVAHMASPFSLVMSVAGVNLAVSVMMGPVAVATVSVIRTLGNLSYQAFNMITQAIWPELSNFVGSGQIDRARNIVIQATRFGVWVSLTASCVMLVAAKPLLAVWTGGKVPLAWGLLTFQLLAIACSSLWRMPAVILQATNRNTRMAVVMFIAATANVLTVILLTPVLGLTAVGLSLFLTELLSAIGVLPDAVRAIQGDLGGFLSAVGTPPSVRQCWQIVRHGKLRPESAAA